MAMASHGRAVGHCLVVCLALGAASAGFAAAADETRAAFLGGCPARCRPGRPTPPCVAPSRPSATINIIEDGPRSAAVQNHGGAMGQPANSFRQGALFAARLARNRAGMTVARAAVDGPTFVDIAELAKSASQLGELSAAPSAAAFRRGPCPSRRAGDIYKQAAARLPSNSEKRAAMARETAEFLGQLDVLLIRQLRRAGLRAFI